MKSIVVSCMVLLLALSAAPSSVFAVKGPPGVVKTAHNMGASSIMGTKATNEDEVCIFCHTPHGGDVSMGMPLWNRSNPQATSFTFYNSNTLSAAGKATTLNLESLMCMSCHDGSIAIDRLINLSVTTDGSAMPLGTNEPDYGGDTTYTQIRGDFSFGAGPKMIGAGYISGTDLWDDWGGAEGFGRLGDDHPVSVSYNGVVTAKPTAFQTEAFAIGRGIRFAGNAAAGEYRVECTSCHDPHVNYLAAQGGDPAYTPFLMTSNQASFLCLSCHNK